MGGTESALAHTDVGEPLPKTQLVENGLWTEIVPGVFRSVPKAAARKVTIFIRNIQQTADADDQSRTYIENGVNTLKLLRHPHIVHYVASSADACQIRLMVDRVRPLQLALDSMHAEEVLCGLAHTLAALVFLHDTAHRCHNNLSPSSIFVGAQGEWQLGSFECSRTLDDTRHWLTDAFVRRVASTAFMPPEDQQAISKDTPAHARDAYSFGKLCEYLSKHFEVAVDAAQMSRVHDTIRVLIFVNATLRPPLRQIDKRIFDNNLSGIVEFLDKLPTQSAAERDAFFRSLTGRLRNLPVSIVSQHLCRRLLQRIVLLEVVAQEHFLCHLFTVRQESNSDLGILPREPFTRYIVPEVLRIMRVRETGVRLALMQHFDSYVHEIPVTTLKTVVVPELLIGMHDTDDRVVAASLRALATCASIVGGAAVTGSTHRRHFADALPREPLPVCDEAAVIASVRAAMLRMPPIGGRGPPIAKASTSVESAARNAPDEHVACSDEHNVVKQAGNEGATDELGRNVNDMASAVNTDTHTATVWSDDWNDKEPACASPAVSTGSSSRTARAHTANTELGAEFDIVANVTIAAAHHGPVDDEPDYFVDMQPTVKRNEVKAVVGDSAASPTATDKFKMAEMTDAVSTAWSTDWDEQDEELKD